MAILEEVRHLSGSEGFVFPGRSKGKPLSNMAFLMQLRRMGRDDLTVHGFRSTFSDWCAEATAYLRMSRLAHLPQNPMAPAIPRDYGCYRHVCS